VSIQAAFRSIALDSHNEYFQGVAKCWPQYLIFSILTGLRGPLNAWNCSHFEFRHGCRSDNDAENLDETTEVEEAKVEEPHEAGQCCGKHILQEYASTVLAFFKRTATETRML